MALEGFLSLRVAETHTSPVVLLRDAREGVPADTPLLFLCLLPVQITLINRIEGGLAGSCALWVSS